MQEPTRAPEQSGGTDPALIAAIVGAAAERTRGARVLPSDGGTLVTLAEDGAESVIDASLEPTTNAERLAKVLVEPKGLREPTEFEVGILNGLQKKGRGEIYAGTVDHATIAGRRTRNKAARASRRINRRGGRS